MLFLCFAERGREEKGGMGFFLACESLLFWFLFFFGFGGQCLFSFLLRHHHLL